MLRRWSPRREREMWGLRRSYIQNQRRTYKKVFLKWNYVLCDGPCRYFWFPGWKWQKAQLTEWLCVIGAHPIANTPLVVPNINAAVLRHAYGRSTRFNPVDEQVTVSRCPLSSNNLTLGPCLHTQRHNGFKLHALCSARLGAEVVWE